AVMGSGKVWVDSYGLGDEYPAYNISYEDVQSFITKLNSMTGVQFRMPTEAEWEFAARGGNQSKGYTYSGSNTIDNVAWYPSNSGSKAHPVKQKLPNSLGIYDMSGNVFEWCSDWYGSDYYSSSPELDPTGPTTGSYRVKRGGGWLSSLTECRCACRSIMKPSYSNHFLGFRLAL
ncbi:MAG: formylglycine-generating enzyme family protein, partial [Bacteroidaceae bacterium]